MSYDALTKRFDIIQEIRHYKMIKWRPKVVLNIIQDIKRSCEVSPGSKVPRVLVHCRYMIIANSLLQRFMTIRFVPFAYECKVFRSSYRRIFELVVIPVGLGILQIKCFPVMASAIIQSKSRRSSDDSGRRRLF